MKLSDDPEYQKWLATQMPKTARLITYKGRTRSMTEWATELGMPVDRLRKRLNAGLSVELAFTKPNEWKTRGKAKG